MTSQKAVPAARKPPSVPSIGNPPTPNAPHAGKEKEGTPPGTPGNHPPRQGGEPPGFTKWNRLGPPCLTGFQPIAGHNQKDETKHMTDHDDGHTTARLLDLIETAHEDIGIRISSPKRIRLRHHITHLATQAGFTITRQPQEPS